MTLVRNQLYPVPAINAYQPLVELPIVGSVVLPECPMNRTLSVPAV